MTQQEYFELQAMYDKEGQSVSWSIANVLRGTNYIDRSTLIAAAYVLLMANDDTIDTSSIDAFCKSINADENRFAFLESCLGDAWQMVVGQRFRYNGNALKSIILFFEDRDMRFGDEGRTPVSISRLACKLFGFTDNDEIADFGLGSAAFTIEAYLSNPTLRFFGIEINASTKEIAAIRLEVLGCEIELEHGNILDMDADSHQYQHIFSNYPFGLRLREIGFDRNRLLQKISQKAAEFTKSVSSDWFFNASIVECLTETGRGIAVMTNGSTWNTLDKSARKYFIENGYLEAVIALPERLFESTTIPTTMIIISRNNERTMLVDATGLCEKGRRFNTFSDAQIEQIAYAVTHETPNSRFVSQDELIDNDFVINPTRYLTEDIVVENGVPFASIIKSITRGAPLKASELDEMVSEEPTDYQYLMLANIQRGQIDAELPYIKGIQDSQRKYCLKNHALILSKNGAPFKVAVAEVPKGKTILANGNLYIIEIDEDKADPYFVKAFLESEKGIALLKSITVGATIPNIGVEALKKIPIPQIPLEEQHALAARYLAKTDEIALLQRKLQKAYEELSHIYDNKE
ncbi:MAG: N-6 DNA methylase [Christensenellales bacterium]